MKRREGGAGREGRVLRKKPQAPGNGASPGNPNMRVAQHQGGSPSSAFTLSFSNHVTCSLDHTPMGLSFLIQRRNTFHHELLWWNGRGLCFPTLHNCLIPFGSNLIWVSWMACRNFYMPPTLPYLGHVALLTPCSS